MVMMLIAPACERRQELTPATGETMPRTQTTANTPSGADAATSGAAPLTASLPGIVSCEPDARLSANLSRVVELADSNEDGRVSKEEAGALVNFLVGGLLFRADANMDGSVTPEEGRKARSDFLRQNPGLSALLDRVRGATGQQPFAAVADLLDVDTTKTLTA
jgi:hypothetical protein